MRYASARSNLEEVDLHGAVAEVQHDGALGAEPQGQVGQPRQLVTLPWRHVGARLQQVLAHVVAEVLQQGDLRREHKKILKNQDEGEQDEMETNYEKVKSTGQ